jgi:hypothetical protein
MADSIQDPAPVVHLAYILTNFLNSLNIYHYIRTMHIITLVILLHDMAKGILQVH